MCKGTLSFFLTGLSNRALLDILQQLIYVQYLSNKAACQSSESVKVEQWLRWGKKIARSLIVSVFLKVWFLSIHAGFFSSDEDSLQNSSRGWKTGSIQALTVRIADLFLFVNLFETKHFIGMALKCLSLLSFFRAEITCSIHETQIHRMQKSFH